MDINGRSTKTGSDTHLRDRAEMTGLISPLI